MNVKSRIRSILDSMVPKRYRLTYEVMVDKVMGRLEDEMLMLPAMTYARGTALDVGANRGFYSYFMCKLFASVHAFEPNAAITTALAHYAHPGLTLHNCALSSASGSLDLYIPIVSGVSYDGWASFDRDNLPEADDYEVRAVDVRTVDEFELTDVSLLKVDVEGHEMDVLAGARKTIERDRPAVIAEIKKRNREAADSFFDELGYTIHLVDAGKLKPLETSLKEYDGARENFIFKPI